MIPMLCFYHYWQGLGIYVIQYICRQLSGYVTASLFLLLKTRRLKALPVLEQLWAPMQMIQRKQVMEKDGFCPEQSPLLFVFFLHLMRILQFFSFQYFRLPN